MSRLDDELKIAFKRKQPSIDLAARVLERINEAPAPKRSWRQALAALFGTPHLRWVAIGVAASLLVATGIVEYRRLQPTPVEERAAPIAQSDPAPEASDTDTKKDQSAGAADIAAAPNIVYKNEQRRTVTPSHSRIYKRDTAARAASSHAALARPPREQPVSAEAEAAKERVLFALQVVGDTLSDAQRVIQEDSRKSRPEPLHNR